MNADTLLGDLRPAWWADASCAGRLDDFYGDGVMMMRLLPRLRATCAACPVLAQCREATDSQPHTQPSNGFRAGETARERVRRWQAEAN